MHKNGLVLEGGGLRGVFTSGVLDAFIENGITFPYVIGVSAGSCNGVSFVARKRHRMKNITLEYAHDERYMSVKSMLKNGEYLNSKWIFGELAYDIHPLNQDAYENSGAVFCCVATNAKTGKAEYFYPKSLRDGCEELRASCALPIATKPVQLGKDLYYDGGLADSIPLKRAFDDGCEKSVVILTQDRTYKKQPMGHQKLVMRFLKKYPQTAKRVMERHIMYNAQREYVFDQEKFGNAFVICPSEPLNTSTLERDPLRLEKIYKLGYKQGLESIEGVKQFMAR